MQACDSSTWEVDKEGSEGHPLELQSKPETSLGSLREGERGEGGQRDWKLEVDKAWMKIHTISVCSSLSALGRADDPKSTLSSATRIQDSSFPALGSL